MNIQKIITNTPHKVEWEIYGWLKSNNNYFSRTNWSETILMKINQIGAQTYQNRNGEYKLIVACSTDLEHIFDSIEYFKILPEEHFSKETIKIGNMQDRYDIYSCGILPRKTIIVGINNLNNSAKNSNAFINRITYKKLYGIISVV